MNVISSVFSSLLLACVSVFTLQAQAPNPDLIAELEAAIENQEVIEIQTVTRVAATIDFLGPIVDNVARGVISVPSPMQNITHIKLQVIQPGGAVAHSAELGAEGRWGRTFTTYKFGVELEKIGIQKGARLTMELYQGAQAVAFVEKELPEQSVRPDYVVEGFKVATSGETVNLNYTFNNRSLQPLTVVPQVTFTNQNIDEGTIVLQKYLDGVSVGPKSEVDFVHELPAPALPGSYEAVVWLFDENRQLVTGALRQVFIMDGDFGVFQSIRLYQDSETNEDMIMVKAMVSPSIADKLTLRLTAEPSVSGAVGDKVLDQEFVVEVQPGYRIEERLPLDLEAAAGGELTGLAQLVLENRVVAEKEFTFLVSPSAEPSVTESVEKNLLTKPLQVLTKEAVSGGFWFKISGGVILFLLIIWFWRWRRKQLSKLLLLGLLMLSSTAFAQSVTLQNTWYYPQADWVYNPLATGDFEEFRNIRFDGSVFNPLTQQGFFQIAPEAIMIRFVNGADYRYSQAFTFTITDKKKYQLDIPVPTDLTEQAWALEAYFKYEGSWYISAWQDEVTSADLTVGMDKSAPTLQPFTYDGATYDSSTQLLQPGLEVIEDEETTLLQARKNHFLDIKANQIQRDNKRKIRKDKIHERNYKIQLLQQEEFAKVNEQAGAGNTADPSAIVAQVNALTNEINGVTQELGENVQSSDLFSTGSLDNAGSLTSVELTPPVNPPFTCAKDTSSSNGDVLQTTYADCVNHFQTQINTLNPQIATKRSELRTAKDRFKKAAIGVEFVCEDGLSGCNPTCNIADDSCGINCALYPLSCTQYQTDNPVGYAANCAGSPLTCNVDCTVDPTICQMRGLITDVRGNFCDNSSYCDDTAVRQFEACDNVGNCIGLSNEAVETDWYDPVQPVFTSGSITRNKGNVGGTETVVNLDTTTGGTIITNCSTQGSGFAAGDGSVGAPYQICNLTQLDNIRNGLNDNYILTANINAADTSTWNSGAGWSPISTFSGSLDGQEFVVKDLFINRANTDDVGLFGIVSANADITNLAVVDANISGQNRVGALVGYWNDGTSGGSISNTYSSGTVDGVSSVGGLIGRMDSNGALLTNAHSTATVVGTATNTGGLVGYFQDDAGNDNGNIKRVYATGNVTGVGYVGGLIGQAVINTLDTHVIENAYAQGNVTGTAQVGGVIGAASSANSPKIEAVYATGTITGSSNVAGIADTDLDIEDSSWIETATVNIGYTADAASGATLTATASFTPNILKAQSSASEATQPYYNWDTAEWNFGTINDFPLLLDSVSYNETIVGNSGTLAATDRFSFSLLADDPLNPDATTHPTLFDTNACGSSTNTGFFLAGSTDTVCSQRYTACALSSTLRGTKDSLLGTACEVACPTVTYDIDGEIVTETYERQGDLCVPRCDYRLFDGCFPFLLIGETCENTSWLPLETSIDEGTVFTQTSNCGDTRNWTGTRPITQSIKHFLDGQDVFGVYFYDTFDDGPGYTDMAFRGQFTTGVDGFTQISSGSITAEWDHEEGYSPNGGKVLKLTSTSLSGGYAAWERAGIPVSANTDYILTYWVKTDADTNRNSDGAWPALYQNGSTVLHSQYATTMKSVTGDLKWAKVEIPFTTGAGATTVDLQLRLESQNNKIAYFDDVVIMEKNWRFNSSQSWYSESKGDDIDGICDYITGDGDGDPRSGGDVRCGEDYFPEKSVVAFTSDGLWVLDAVDGVMWMSSLRDPFGGWRFVFNTLLSGQPFASNGKLISAFRFNQGAGRNGAVTIGDFINDTMYSHRMSNCFTLSGYKGVGSGYSQPWCNWATQRAYNWSGFVNDTITSRNINRNPWTTVMPSNIALGNHQINAMHSNIVGGKEYIVVAHDYIGITILNKTDDTVQYLEFDGDDHNDPSYPEWDDLPSTANKYRDVYLADDGRLYYLWDYYVGSDTKTRLHVIDDITTLPFDGSQLTGTSTYDQRIQPNSASSSYPTTALNDTANALDVKDERILMGGDTGFELFKGDITGGSQHPDLYKQRVTRSFASAPLFRDVWGHWVTGVQDVSGKGHDLTNVNGVNISVVSVGGDLQQFNFNNDAYLVSGNGDFNIGNTLTFGTWLYTDSSSSDDGGYIMAQKDAVDTEFALYRTSDNKLRVEGSTADTVDDYTLDGWNYVVATFDGTTKRAYIDGVKVLEVSDVIGGSPSSVTGRYVRVTQSDDSKYLSLAEVEVFATSNLSVNIAGGGSATQSSTGWSGVASRAIDGNTNGTYFGSNSTTHTGVTSGTWWELDLGSEQDLGRFKIWNRTDCCLDRLEGAILTVLDASRNVVYTSPSFNGVDSQTFSLSSTSLDPSNLTYLDEYDDDSGSDSLDQASAVEIRGNYAYVTGRRDNTLQIFDISDPANIVRTGGLSSGSTLDGAYDIDVAGNYAYIAAYDDDELSIYDISNPASPSFVASETDSSNLNGIIAVDVVGNYAYVANYNDDSVAVIDVSNPSNPTWLSEYDSSSNIDQPYDIKVVGNYAYVAANASDALSIIDISNPNNITYVGKYSSSTYLNGARAVEVVGNYAYVAAYDRDSMAVIDISNPASPSFVNEVRMSSNLNGARGITIDGDYAYVAAYRDDSIQVIDISSPTTPTWIGEYPTSASLNGVIDLAVVADKIYTASWNDDSFATFDIGETVSSLPLTIGAGETGGGTTTLLNGSLALPFVAEGAYSDQNVRDAYNGTRDWFGENILLTLQGSSDEVVKVKFGDFGSYFVATNGGGITHFDYSGRVLRTISASPTSETNVQIVSNSINDMDYRNGWLIIAYQGRGVEIVNIAPLTSELLSNFDTAEFDPYFFY